MDTNLNILEEFVKRTGGNTSSGSRLDSLPFMRAHLNGQSSSNAEDTDEAQTDTAALEQFTEAINNAAETAAVKNEGTKEKLLPNGKKTKGKISTDITKIAGRVKIKMEFIGNKLRRYTTFSKRKTGIMKKAYELSTLTGTQILLLVASETGHLYTFATDKLQPVISSDEGKALIQRCLNSGDGVRSGSGTDPFTKAPACQEAVASLNSTTLNFVPSNTSANSAAKTPTMVSSDIKGAEQYDDDSDMEDSTMGDDASTSDAPTTAAPGSQGNTQTMLLASLLPTLLQNPTALSAALQLLPSLQAANARLGEHQTGAERTLHEPAAKQRRKS